MTPAGVLVREARPDEYAEAGRVTAAAYRALLRPDDDLDDWGSYLARIADVADRARRTLVLLAVDNDTIVGSATLELDGRTEEDDDPLDPDRAHVRMLGIDPAAQGRGAGRALMRACEERARASGKTRITLHTTERMQVAQRMYEALGYERSEDHVFPDGFRLLGYAKELGLNDPPASA
ncbi:MAG: GNAT family N-acetyltransferase [Actinomycetota bacterium]